MWSTALLRKQEKSYRVAPVAEFFMHVGDAKSSTALWSIRTYPRVFNLHRPLRSRHRQTSEGHGMKNLVQSELDAGSHALAGNLLSF